MKLIIGLGNPGKVYAATRHNIGSVVVSELARQLGVTLKREARVQANCSKAQIDGQELALALPLTYMNLSGQAVRLLVEKYKVALSDVLVVYDDVDLCLGRIRLRSAGSAGGHNGVKSIIACLHTKEFCRLRIGVDRPSESTADMAEYVLSVFNRQERKALTEILEKACEAARAWVDDGIEKSMNFFNR
jgi:PTH1 family peptidyl-tRNA hydrolase